MKNILQENFIRMVTQKKKLGNYRETPRPKKAHKLTRIWVIIYNDMRRQREITIIPPRKRHIKNKIIPDFDHMNAIKNIPDSKKMPNIHQKRPERSTC